MLILRKNPGTPIGVGCTNELPLKVSFTAQLTVNLSTNLNNMAAGPSTTNAFVRVKLEKCSTNNPQVQGVGIVLRGIRAGCECIRSNLK